MQTSNKKIIIIVVVALLVVALAAGTIYILINSQKPQETSAEAKKEQADTLQTQAIDAIKNNDTETAKTLLEEANQQYKDLNNTDKTIDTDAQLYALNHPSTPSETIDTTVPPITN